jgi:hypothetical protein
MVLAADQAIICGSAEALCGCAGQTRDAISAAGACYHATFRDPTVHGVAASPTPSRQSHLCFLLGQWSIVGARKSWSSRQPTDTDNAPISRSARMNTTDPHMTQNACSNHCPDEPVRRQDLVSPFWPTTAESA